jgi:adenosine kinase
MNFSGNYHELIDATKLEVLSLSVLVDSLKVSEGGIGANIAHYLAALGEQATLLGSIGNDGQDYLNRLNERGIDTSAVHQSSLPTASFNVLTDTSGNQVGGFYPGAMSDADTLSFVPWANSDGEILACVSAHDPAAMRRQIEECVEHNLRLVYDPGQQVSTIPPDDLRAGVRAAEVVFVNEYELSMLCKRTGLSEADIQTSVPVLISTLGQLGSRIFDSRISESFEVAIAKPDKFVDPTGAGDAYRAGFLYGYLRQWDVRKCGQLGSVIASFALENHGPQSELTQEAVIKRYQKTFNERIEL